MAHLPLITQNGARTQHVQTGDTHFVPNGLRVGGTTAPVEILTADGVVALQAQGSNPSTTASYGKAYVKTDKKLYFKNADGVVSSVIDSSYRIVATTTVRDAIAGDDLVVNMRVFVANERRVYSWDGTDWLLLEIQKDLDLARTLTNYLAIADRYIATTGNDATGTGLIGAPYRTMKRLVDSLPAGLSGTLNVHMQDAGPYPSISFPDLIAAPFFALVFIASGTAIASYPSLAVGTHDANTAGGDKVSRWKYASAGAHAALSAGSHWIRRTTTEGYVSGFIVDHANSTSPAISIVSGADQPQSFPGDYDLVPFTTELEDEEGFDSIIIQVAAQTNKAQIFLVGFWTDNYVSVYDSGSSLHLEGFAQNNAAKSSFYQIGGETGYLEQHALYCAGGVAFIGNGTITLSGIFDKLVDFAGGATVLINGALRGGVAGAYSCRCGFLAPLGSRLPARVTFNVDFEGDAIVNIYAFDSQIRLYDDGYHPTTDGQATNFLQADEASLILCREDGNATVFGSTTGACVGMSTASRSRGLAGHDGETGALRNTTTPGNDVSITGAFYSWGALPVSDLTDFVHCT